MDYNTNREKLILPEYGRHVQKMIEQVKRIPDREKRNEQIRAVVSVMAILNPQVMEQPDYMHKLWDHVQISCGTMCRSSPVLILMWIRRSLCPQRRSLQLLRRLFLCRRSLLLPRIMAGISRIW